MGQSLGFFVTHDSGHFCGILSPLLLTAQQPGFLKCIMQRKMRLIEKLILEIF